MVAVARRVRGACEPEPELPPHPGRPVTVEHLKEKGATHFAWCVQDMLGAATAQVQRSHGHDSSVLDAVGRRLPPIAHGGFLYKCKLSDGLYYAEYGYELLLYPLLSAGLH